MLDARGQQAALGQLVAEGPFCFSHVPDGSSPRRARHNHVPTTSFQYVAGDLWLLVHTTRTKGCAKLLTRGRSRTVCLLWTGGCTGFA